jgi:Cu/Zn superoxide dismutase
VLAEHDADGGILLAGFHEAVEVVDVHLHLPEVLMGDLADLQIDQDIAAQQAVVEDQIHEEMVFVEGESLLARLETGSPCPFPAGSARSG